MSDETRCEVCESESVFRTRLWWRGCRECGSSHQVCGSCIDEWDLRLVGGRTSPDGRLQHLDCPDGARVAKELMEEPRPKMAERGRGIEAAKRAWAARKGKA